MKKSLIIPVVLLAAGSLFFASCGSNDTDTSMKSPSATNTEIANQKENVENKTIAKPVSMTTSTEAKSKTIENMQAAFKGETTASAKYAAYSNKAVLLESGNSVPAISPEYAVKSTKENLEDAVKGETYEVTTMYPEFLTVANQADDQLALISLNYAYKTEKKHKAMYETALAALQNNTANTLPAVYYVCPTCGNTYETTAPARCGISMTKSDKFIKITAL